MEAMTIKQFNKAEREEMINELKSVVEGVDYEEISRLLLKISPEAVAGEIENFKRILGEQGGTVSEKERVISIFISHLKELSA